MGKKIEKIQYITQENKRFTHAEQALLMFENGIRWVQIRMKSATENELVKQSQEALGYSFKYNATLIINDNIEVAKKIGAHGVHLGLNDIPVNEARDFLGDEFIIGGTANSFEDVVMQIDKGADYVGLGPYRFTLTKKNLSPVLGIEGYKEILKRLREAQKNIPIVAVGGITLPDIATLENIGLYGAAISSALMKEYSCLEI